MGNIWKVIMAWLYAFFVALFVKVWRYIRPVIVEFIKGAIDAIVTFLKELLERILVARYRWRQR